MKLLNDWRKTEYGNGIKPKKKDFRESKNVDDWLSIGCRHFVFRREILLQAEVGIHEEFARCGEWRSIG